MPTDQETTHPHEETQAKTKPKQALQEQEDPHMKKMLKTLENKEKVATDKVLKESLQWEICIIKQAIKQFPKIEQLYEAHKQTTLPLVLLKFEHDMHLEELMPQCPLEQLGGYHPLTHDEINGKSHLLNQPLWQLAYIQKHTATILEYANAPRYCKIDPTYCPIKRRYTWDAFEKILKFYPTRLNYPSLLGADRFCSSTYFISTLKYAIDMYDGAPDIVCRMLVKIAHLLLLIVDTFHKELPHNWPWEIMLEGNQALTFDLHKGPNRKQVMGLYARC